MRKLSPDKVREARDRAWMSQQDTADESGVSLFTVQRIERGEGAVRPGTARAIARALGVTPDELAEEPAAPKAEPPRELVEPGAGDIEDSEPDALANIVRRLSALGEEVAASNAGSAELLRDLKVMDYAAGEAFDAYRTRLEQGEETNELTGATQDLVAASVAVLEAFRAAEAREADPGKEAEVVDLPNLRRRARTSALRRDEGRASSAS